MRGFGTGLWAAMMLVVSIGTASAEDLRERTATICARQGRTSAAPLNCKGGPFQGACFHRENASKPKNSALAFYGQRKSRTPAILGTAFTNAFKSFTVSAHLSARSVA